MNITYDGNSHSFCLEIAQSDIAERIQIPVHIAVLLADYYKDQMNRQSIASGSFKVAVKLESYNRLLDEHRVKSGTKEVSIPENLDSANFIKDLLEA